MSKRALQKSLDFKRLTLYGVGTIIGAGIYSVVGPAAEIAGNAIWISFIVAAAIAALTALSYAELASALPNAGAEHSFLRQAIPRFPAFAFVVGLFIAVHGAATFATVALTFGSYARSIITFDARVMAVALIVLATAINIAGVARASAVSAILTVFQIGCLVAFAITALATQGAVVSNASSPENWSDILKAAAILFFIYSGFEHMATLSEEAKNPSRDLWRAFIAALSITAAVYVVVIFGVLALVQADAIAKSDFPLAAAAEKLGYGFPSVIIGAALLATANAVLSASLSGSRLLFGMSRSGDLPSFLQQTIKVSKSPWAGALVIAIAAVVFVMLGEIKMVASLSSLGVTLVFAAVNAAVIILRYTKPKLNRPFAVPSIGNVPVTAILGVVFSLLLSAQYDWIVYTVFGGAFLAGALPYAFLRRSRR